MKRKISLSIFIFSCLCAISQTWISPSSYEQKSEWNNDELWYYYDKNGVVVKQTATIVQTFYRLSLIIVNNSNSAILIDPQNVVAYSTTKKGDKPLHTLSVCEYMRRLETIQGFAAAFYALSENLEANSAGYSTSTSTTYSSYNGYVDAQAYGSAYGSGGYAYGSSSGYGTYSGSGTTTTTTRTYDAGAAQNAQYRAQQNIAAKNNALYNERMNKRASLLPKTTLYPGEYISGYVYIRRRLSYRNFENDVIINGAKYHFSWSL